MGAAGDGGLPGNALTLLCACCERSSGTASICAGAATLQGRLSSCSGSRCGSCVKLVTPLASAVPLIRLALLLPLWLMPAAALHMLALLLLLF